MEAEVAVCVVAAFFALAEEKVIVLSRVVPVFAVGVVGFDVGDFVDAHGMRSFVTFTCVSLSQNDHPHHPSSGFVFISSVIVHVPDA